MTKTLPKSLKEPDIQVTASTMKNISPEKTEEPRETLKPPKNDRLVKNNKIMI